MILFIWSIETLVVMVRCLFFFRKSVLAILGRFAYISNWMLLTSLQYFGKLTLLLFYNCAGHLDTVGQFELVVSSTALYEPWSWDLSSFLCIHRSLSFLVPPTFPYRIAFAECLFALPEESQFLSYRFSFCFLTVVRI